jgi:hypothetical protein
MKLQGPLASFTRKEIACMNIKDIALGDLTNAFRAFTQDLEALPEEAFDKSYGGKTRPVADIVQEINLFNDHIGHVLRGETPFDWPEWDFPSEGPRTKEAVLQSFRISSERILTAIEGMTAEDLEAAVPTDGGRAPYHIGWAAHGEATRFQRCRFMAIHAWYHCGQLNYIQALSGDGECHWG